METSPCHGLGAETVSSAQHHAKDRDSCVDGVGEYTAEVTHLGCLFCLRANHESRGVDKNNNGNVESIANLNKTGSLVCAVRVYGPCKVKHIVCHQPEGMSFDSNKCRDDAHPELRAELQDRTRVRQGIDDFPAIICPAAHFRAHLT